MLGRFDSYETISLQYFNTINHIDNLYLQLFLLDLLFVLLLLYTRLTNTNEKKTLIPISLG